MKCTYKYHHVIYYDESWSFGGGGGRSATDPAFPADHPPLPRGFGGRESPKEGKEGGQCWRMGFRVSSYRFHQRLIGNAGKHH
jgi:hypothetical protein